MKKKCRNKKYKFDIGERVEAVVGYRNRPSRYGGLVDLVIRGTVVSRHRMRYGSKRFKVYKLQNINVIYWSHSWLWGHTSALQYTTTENDVGDSRIKRLCEGKKFLECDLLRPEGEK